MTRVPDHSAEEARPALFGLPTLWGFSRVFLPVVLLLAVVAMVFYFRDLSHEKQIFERDAGHSLSLQTEILASDFKSITSDLNYLAEQSQLQTILSDRSTEREEKLAQDYLLFCRKKSSYDQIRLLDEHGQEIVRVNYHSGEPRIVPQDQLQPKGSRNYFERTFQLERDEIYISPFDLNVENEVIEVPHKPVIRFATPVFDHDGRKRGILILNYLGAGLIHKLEEAASGFAGISMLLNKDGFWLRSPVKEDEWGFMLGNTRSFPTDYPALWQVIEKSGRGQEFTQDGYFRYGMLDLDVCIGQTPAESQGFSLRGDNQIYPVLHVPRAVLYARPQFILSRFLIVYAIALVIIAVFLWFLVYNRLCRKCDQQSLLHSEQRLRLLSRQLLHAQEQERKRISRDLHDDLGQLTTAICLDLDRAGKATDGKTQSGILRALGNSRQLLDKVQSIAAQLRPSLLDDLGLKDAVQDYLAQYEDRTGIDTRSHLRFDHERLPETVSETLYRILQETLTNAERHARADTVEVSLIIDPDEIELTVLDNGTGFDPKAIRSGCLGIMGMRERTELLGGSFQLETASGEGTEIRARLPLDANAELQEHTE